MTKVASLPNDFIWGFATASYQIEGAIKQDGRAPSIWDTFCAKPGKIADGTDGSVACNSYNRTKEDIDLLKLCGAKAYRFSLSWSRIIPKGGRNDLVNEKGLQHYVKFVDDLLAAGITPFVTLYHWDLPEELDQRYRGLLNRDEFPLDFARYARVVFEAMGSRVKNWITFNEPFCSSVLGYSVGVHAPGRTSNRKKNEEGDSSTEPWLAGHSILVAHGHAVKIYRDEFKGKHGGEIGITLNGDWAYPYDTSDPKDVEAAARRLDFSISWFGDPIYKGTYPASMREQLGDRLPTFTDAEIALVHGSNDFYGMNHYTANYIKHVDTPAPLDDYIGNVEQSFENSKGESIGPETQSPWLRPNPQGFRNLIGWISQRYDYPKIYVTENGTSILKENDKTKDEILADDFRVQYYSGYIQALAEAVAQDGVNCKGYFGWSLMDNFEWAEGYETRFGVTFVDYENEQKRYPKRSAKALQDIVERYIGQ